MATESHRDRLAAIPSFRERITVRHAPLTERLAARARLDAFVALFANAPRKPDAIYELQRSEPRSGLPDERQRRLIHEGIRAGYITRDQIVAYRATQLLDDLSTFGRSSDAADALYVAYMTETAEAVEAQTVARGVKSGEAREAAIRETREAIAVAEMQVAALARSA
jgi:hypothetical protein